MWLVTMALDGVGEDRVSFIKCPALGQRHPHGNFYIDAWSTSNEVSS